MPQMFPMSWIFIYLYVLVWLFMVVVVVSYSGGLSLFSDGGGIEGGGVVEFGWQW